MKHHILDSKPIIELVRLVEEAARSTEESVKYFVEPAPGTLSRATSRRHHLVFGRRGSGKSSLLRKGASELTLDRRPVAYVNLEAFKGHSHPDVLLSILVSTFNEFKNWMETAAVFSTTKKTFWKRLFDSIPKRPPFRKNIAGGMANELKDIIRELEEILHKSDEAEISKKKLSNRNQTHRIGGGYAGGPASANIGRETQEEATEAIEEQFRRSKIDFLHQNVIKYQNIFNELGRMSSGDAFLFLDDLYHIKRDDQSRVVDYFHRIAKDKRLWLKIGTIRHRSTWYVHGNPTFGMKLGDDADEIDLDVTLEKYRLAKDFLKSVLTNFSSEVGIKRNDEFMTSGAFDRLVLASGGVARDFLSIFRKAIEEGRERGGGARGDRIGAEDVNVAAGNHDSSKREEFRRDTSDDDEAMSLEKIFLELKNFCLEENNTNCFLMNKDQHGSAVDHIRELVDLKLIHLVRSRVTVSSRPGQIYEAFMLDVSQYAGSRKRRNLKLIEFWRTGADEALRKARLIYPSTSSK